MSLLLTEARTSEAYLDVKIYSSVFEYCDIQLILDTCKQLQETLGNSNRFPDFSGYLCSQICRVLFTLQISTDFGKPCDKSCETRSNEVLIAKICPDTAEHEIIQT